MECLVVMECIYNSDAHKSPALLCFVASKSFGQWLFEKVKQSNRSDTQTDNDSE